MSVLPPGIFGLGGLPLPLLLWSQIDSVAFPLISNTELDTQVFFLCMIPDHVQCSASHLSGVWVSNV